MIFIVVTLGLAIYFRLYYLFWWLDILHHFLGGLWLVLFFNFSIKHFKIMLTGDWRAAAFFLTLIGLVALVGVGWEFFEFIWDRFIWHAGFTYLPGIYEDTLSDLFFDLLGGATGFVLVL